MAEEQGPIRQGYNFAQTGLNLDLLPSQIKKGMLTYALNAGVENFDANSINYQNEQGNEFCVTFPEGFVLIGTHFINEKSKHIFMLTNPNTGECHIGYMDNNDCQYRIYVNDKCLGWDINHPIHKMAHKITNCTTEIYWADNVARRWLDLENIPYKLKEGSDVCNGVYTDEVDCNQLKVQPNFSIPQLSINRVTNSGDIISGTYQFAVQYCDASGNAYTSYYSITNPTPIADPSVITPNFNYRVGKSIIIDVSDLDVTGQFKYFNLAVIKTINGISSAELAGTYFIDSATKEITYTGQNVENIRLSMNDIFEKFPYYDIAQDVTNVQDILVWDQLSSIDRTNYQQIANKIRLQWETWRIPADENYADELNATNFRSFLRDEVYSVEVAFLLTNGKQTDGFHIPGRIKNFNEINFPDIPDTDPDFIGDPAYVQGGTGYSPYWMIYNTGSVTGTSSQYSNAANYKGPYQYGEFAYWESTEEYPCNEDMWGELAGQKIRHHKFPDVLVSPIFESKSFGGEAGMIIDSEAVFPIGIKIDVAEIRSLITSSNLTAEQKADIVGFKILRGDRSTNKSVIAKGILRNVGRYEREDRSFYFPNYPYNDLNQDVFINGVNNAYAEECLSYDIYVTELYTDNATGESYASFNYIDCNTNKDAVATYLAVGFYTLCSIGRPSILAGEGKAGNSDYEIWEAVHACGTCRGYRVAFYDRFLGYTEEWIDGAPGGGTKTFQVVPNSGGVVYAEGPGNPKITFIGNVDSGIDCGESTALPAIKDTPELAYRQIFNSPETSFGNPYLGNILKLESVMFGRGRGHFVEVKDNAKYKLITEEAQRDALRSAEQMAALADPFDPSTMFTAYNAYVQIYINGITRKNFAYSYNSIASYDYSYPIPNGEGIKQRILDIKKYLVPSVVSTGDDFPINNWYRETSVYLRTRGAIDSSIPPLPYPDQSPSMLSSGTPIITDVSRFIISDTPSKTSNCTFPAKEEDLTVVSYYASLKNSFVNQWGQIYSYNTLDTGYQNTLTGDANNVIFGGDTFISRFAFKTKLPFFIDHRVNAPDDSDIFYDEIGNIGFPRFWHSARSILKSYQIEILPNMAYPPEESFPLTNIISYKAHNFDCPNYQGTSGQTGVPGRTFYNGYFYLFAYGIPNFYCETSYNVDLRQAFNNKEGDFWPHVTNHIPDDWVQESFVPIAQDNTYYYNTTFSKQNKENVFTHLPPDWENKPCLTHYPFRAIYSDSQNTDADDKVNAWLNYRVLSYFDFPQNYGKLTSLDGIQNRAILARFENKSLLYDNLLTIDTSNPQAAYVGNPMLFKGAPPIDFAETDLGYVGSQHKMLLKIPQGQFTIDAKRGQLFLLNGKEAIDLSAPGSGMNRFFTDHLAFEILRYFPNINVDNHFAGVGLHGVYDSKFDRLIITKIDYTPLSPDIKYDAVTGEFYIENITEMTVCDCALWGMAYNVEDCELNGRIVATMGTTTTTTTTRYGCSTIESVTRIVVSLKDPEYFCNKSWTLSYNMNTKSWISFHSYIPNWYIAENNFFYSGINSCCEDFDFVAVTIGTTTSTTSTTSTNIPHFTTTTSTSTTSTTSTTTSTSTSTTTTTTTIYVCQRPMDLKNYQLIGGYTLAAPPVTFVSTGSQEEACSALDFLLDYDYNSDLSSNMSPIYVRAQGTGISVGVTLYYDWTTDCTLVPDGWYFTDELIYTQTVFHVLNGVIVEIASCLTTTTTTSTTTTCCPTSTTTTTMIPIPCGNGIGYDSDGIYENIYTIDLGAATGNVLLDFDTVSLPDRIIVVWNASQVIDTGYYGSLDYDFGGINRSVFNNALLGKTDPVTTNAYPDAGTYPDDGYPRITFPSTGTEVFNKTNASPSTADVHIYSPLGNSQGEFLLYCPGITTTTSTTSTTSTTTTAIPSIYQYKTSNVIYPSELAACSALGIPPLTVYSDKLPASLVGNYLYNDAGLTSICILSNGYHILVDGGMTKYAIVTTSSVVVYENAC